MGKTDHEHDAPKPCATCGTCPTCGRRPQNTVYPYWDWTYRPYIYPYTQPYITWGTGTAGTPAYGNYTVTNAAN